MPLSHVDIILVTWMVQQFLFQPDPPLYRLWHACVKLTFSVGMSSQWKVDQWSPRIRADWTAMQPASPPQKRSTPAYQRIHSVLKE